MTPRRQSSHYLTTHWPSLNKHALHHFWQTEKIDTPETEQTHTHTPKVNVHVHEQSEEKHHVAVTEFKHRRRVGETASFLLITELAGVIFRDVTVSPQVQLFKHAPNFKLALKQSTIRLTRKQNLWWVGTFGSIHTLGKSELKTKVQFSTKTPNEKFWTVYRLLRSQFNRFTNAFDLHDKRYKMSRCCCYKIVLSFSFLNLIFVVNPVSSLSWLYWRCYWHSPQVIGYDGCTQWRLRRIWLLAWNTLQSVGRPIHGPFVVAVSKSSLLSWMFVTDAVFLFIFVWCRCVILNWLKPIKVG